MRLEGALMLVVLVAIVGCLIGAGSVAIAQGTDCDKVAARVGYPDAITRDDGEGCHIYIGQDENGQDVWAWARK